MVNIPRVFETSSGIKEIKMAEKTEQATIDGKPPSKELSTRVQLALKSALQKELLIPPVVVPPKHYSGHLNIYFDQV